MELIDRFDKKFWKAADATNNAGFMHYRISSRLCVGPGQFKYNIIEENEHDRIVLIKGTKGKQDPMKGIGNAELKLNADDTQIMAIIVEDEMVTYCG